MDERYKPAMDFAFTTNHNGLLTDEDRAEATKQWHDFVKKTRPLTQEIYKALTQEEKRLYHRGGPAIFVPAGGLMLLQSNRSHKAYTGIIQALKEKALQRALNSRKKWGWTGAHLLTDPEGHSKPSYSNGQAYGPFTKGDDHLLGRLRDTDEPKPPKYYTP